MAVLQGPGYHPGELAAQRRAGETDRAAHLARSLRTEIPDVAARFLADRQLLAVGAVDEEGRVWATVLSGPAGFATAPDPRTVRVAARPTAGDPLAPLFAEGARSRLGTLALEPTTRRRMRVNGRAVATAEGVRIRTEEVFSNCPKYIQKRQVVAASDAAVRPGPVRRGPELGVADGVRLSTADTFFLATADAEGRADISHRGGNPGFLRVLSPTRLRWPDYPGNAAFMSLGNLEVNPSAGLAVPDWETGDLLLVQGRAAVEWDAADRAVELTVDQVVHLPGALPLRWSEPEFSPANPPVG
ncbi:pyridoxamine 5'-phosphate oxidase family protein [Streptacidiphilus monticola]|uniref:Pyridoxamine 5'-phosphate oxidase family protein n=1 Tax=Streptacidiphilus monticola TaxID=2161674 RepID=A0ABW1G4V2_9ACTN